jgi:hypothetical protein
MLATQPWEGLQGHAKKRGGQLAPLGQIRSLPSRYGSQSGRNEAQKLLEIGIQGSDACPNGFDL